MHFNFSSYERDALRREEESDLRKEYSRLRSIAQKRLQRMGNSRYAVTDTYELNRDKYKKLDEINSSSELRALLHDVQRFLTAKRGSISGLKALDYNFIEKMHQQGFNFVNYNNLSEFYEFLEMYKQKDIDNIYDSGDVIKLFEVAQDKNISAELLEQQFNLFVENVDTLQNLPKGAYTTWDEIVKGVEGINVMGE